MDAALFYHPPPHIFFFFFLTHSSVYKAPPFSYSLHFLSNGTLICEKTVVASEKFYGRLLKNAFPLQILKILIGMWNMLFGPKAQHWDQ